MENSSSQVANLSCEIIHKLNEMDLTDLVEATISAMSEANGFNIGSYTYNPTQSDLIRTYWEGVLLVPERRLIVGRLDGVIAGAAQMLLPSPSNQTSQFACQVDNLFTAQWARGYGLSNLMLAAIEEEARILGKTQIRLSVRETRSNAIALFEKRGFVEWGYLPHYEIQGGAVVGGKFFFKAL